MKCLVIPQIHDKAAVAPKYHKGYRADIDLQHIPLCDFDSLLSAMSVAVVYTRSMPGGMMITQYGLDLCRCGYSYVSDWISLADYSRIAKYYSFDKMTVSSVYGTAPQYTDTDSVMISGGDKHE